ncbi:MAG TPA: efflux RND transporter permease subunit [Candidatus Acidoferrales bacterium]|nr:efflux RND transporter permease subunit [Candidatus Acidoferrales bacterium]
MWIVRLALRRPYTFVVVSLLIAILGVSAIITMPVDIFPYIDIPVVSIVWQYSGMSPEEMEKRVLSYFERSMTTTVNDIEHIESQAYSGVSVTRVYFQPAAKIEVALSQITAIAQTLLRPLPPGITPPAIIKYDASSVPIIQLGLESQTMSEQELFDMGQNFIRTQLATIQGASVPLPYGGKFRSVMVDINPDQMFAKGLSATDVSAAFANQNLIFPAGTAKIGDKDYQVKLNNAPRLVDDLNNLPLRVVNGATVYVRDVAQVRDGYSVQTSIVRTNGTRGALLTVMRSGKASTLAVVNDVKEAMPKILAGLPPALKVRQLFDQSLFVRAAISGVVREATMAACLTGMMILLFLGSWRSTIIVCISIPLSILVSLIILNLLGQTTNVMTLGGLALAVGILVDDATVELENTHRNMAMRKPLVRAVLDGAQQIAAPAFVSTLSICIVFVPVLLLTGAAKYLFTPLALAVVFAMMASYFLSRTLIPTMVHYMLKPEVALYALGEHAEGGTGLIWRVHYLFNRRFEMMRSSYAGLLHWCLDHRGPVLAGFGLFVAGSLCLAPLVGRDFFPTVDSGAMRLHAQAPSGTRLEKTEMIFADIENEIRQVVPPREIENIIDNIGIPNGGFNLAFGDNPSLGTGDGDILISLKPGEHAPTSEYIGRLRKRLNAKFPDVVFFFEAANITNQILNFGLPAPIDVQVVGHNVAANYPIAQQIAAQLTRIPGAADVHIHQIVDYPEIDLDVDRSKASQVGLTQRDVATSLLISLSSSGQIAPTQFLDWRTGVSYNVAVQTPQYRNDSLEAVLRTPISAPFSAVNSNTATSLAGSSNVTGIGAGPSQASLAYGNPGSSSAGPQLLSNLVGVSRSVAPAIINHYNVQPVFDVYANVDRRDLGSVGAAVEKVVQQFIPKLPRGSSIDIRGQLRTMETSFYRLGLGMIFAVVLVYLLMAVNFQSWLDPFIILMALPGALAGIVWMLFITQTTFSVPSLMGSIMCIGVATANSILMVVFANDERVEGLDARSAALSAGHTRIRPVIMTASAMIIGMLPMALGLGEGGEQNAPLGRAVIGGLLLATITTLFVVPLVYSLLRKNPPIDFERRILDEEQEYMRDQTLLREDL